MEIGGSSNELFEIIEAMTGHAASDDTLLEALDIDPLQRVGLIRRFERLYDVRFSAEETAKFEKVSDIHSALDRLRRTRDPEIHDYVSS